MRHALLAKQLIAACGGLDECEAALAGRLKRSRLGDFQNPKAQAFMPIDVVAELEAFCGEPIYSQAIAAERPARGEGVSLGDEAAGLVLSAARVLQVARDAGADPLVEADARELEAALAAVERQVREVRAAAGRGRS